MRKKRVGVIDYGRGNLHSVSKALEAVGAEVRVSDSTRALDLCDAIVLPGVGAFGDALASLRRRRLSGFVRSAVKSGRPFLGVCLGLQLLCEDSTEFGLRRGFGVFPAAVRRFPRGLTIPHMGWNQVQFAPGLPLAKGLGKSEEFYFVHSFRSKARDKSVSGGVTRYGKDVFDSVLWKDNVFAVQFHPEKSQRAGLAVYRNFWRLAVKPGR